MQLSTRGRYAVMAMVDLATRQALRLRVRTGLPGGDRRAAAAQPVLSGAIVRQVAARRAGGARRAARAAAIGWRARQRRSPSPTSSRRWTSQSTPRDVRGVAVHGRADGRWRSGERCQTHDLWDELGRQIRLFLEGVTLADVVTGRVLGRAVAWTEAVEPLARIADGQGARAAPPARRGTLGEGRPHAPRRLPQGRGSAGSDALSRRQRHRTAAPGGARRDAGGAGGDRQPVLRARRRPRGAADHGRRPRDRWRPGSAAVRRRPGLHLRRHRGRCAGDPCALGPWPAADHRRHRA